MTSALFDGTDLMRVLNNTVDYAQTYLREIHLGQAKFNSQVAVYVKNLLYKYIDSQARLYPERLAHVYEPGFNGAASQRLFTFETHSTLEDITFTARFNHSTLPSTEGGVAFEQRAQIMEDGMAVTIAPKNGNVLAFDVDGETVFTTKPITIDHPGGPEAAGAFKDTIDSFFNQYLTNVVMMPIFEKMSKSRAFTNYFSAGVQSPSNAGRAAARQFLDATGGILE